MNKKGTILISAVVLVLLITAVLIGGEDTTSSSLEGRFVGYSWRGEARGVEFADADRYIETILDLDEKGIIQDARMRFFVQQDGYWTKRSSGNAFVDVDFSVYPTAAVPGENYQAGDSMFTIYTADMMSFYAVGVNDDGVVAVAIVDPVIRYQHEMRFEADFDFDRPMGDLTYDSGYAVPTIRTSGSGLMKPEDWDSLANNTFLNINIWSHVMNDYGVLTGIDESSSVRDFLKALGVDFAGGQPQSMSVEYGYHSSGGWNGNFRAIEDYLIGKDASELRSLIDWSNSRYGDAVNEDNIFAVDVPSGATRTVQNSFDGIAGATVRLSREDTSFQRALVNAGIISEEDVIIGRF
ncbi:hypothetical protein [Natronospora cellulosivora (SeqCode)]